VSLCVWGLCLATVSLCVCGCVSVWVCVGVCLSVCLCVCVGALSSDGDALCMCLLLPHVGVRNKLPPDLLRDRLPSAMPRQSKFDKAMLKVMEADWVVRHRMLSWMRRLSQRAPHLVLMLTACQTPLSDYIVAHLSATCRSPLIDFRFAHMLATLVSQRLYCRLSLNDIKSLMQASSREHFDDAVASGVTPCCPSGSQRPSGPTS
jgi:hypothetical protein